MIAPAPALRDISGDVDLPTPYGDVDLLRAHEKAGHDPADVRYLSLGATWRGPHPALARALGALPAHAHDYLLTPRGWPALVDVLRPYITTTHRLAGVAELGTDYDVAACGGHTRAVMPDFARLLVDEARESAQGSSLRGLRALVRGRRPIAVASAPRWDYDGVLGPIGYEMRSFDLRRQDEYQPHVAEVTEVLNRARRDTTGPVLLILNSQHNPTAANWLPEAVRGMIRAALATGAAILVDDAYYGVTDPGIVPTSALAILLEELRDIAPADRPRWLAVRSLGKQFQVNGWGVGSQVASPDTLRLLGERLTRRTYPGSPLEPAMAAWLTSPESSEFLTHRNRQLAATRATVGRLLVDELGYPPSAFFTGECAAYMLARIPPWMTGCQDYRRAVLTRAGVLLGEANMSSPGQGLRSQHEHVRIFLGADQQTLAAALKSMSVAGFTWRRPRWR
ncbi:aminotransferase class I/II-fold pyridoxal phosphate-dependent enzyme [Streptomyces sp. NBC_00838]|uniref:aminotransferase class I/II-fold pyridoxal phosphate-dependent enzyme n=1 Tax=Streptomyces sp. NBC_00838 TaxID=2903680 RepID=UPI0038683101|nr:aminotransferase class I/II-fold pyridoxal phosphate-dependent enzyme [Streptomyces sp. NBC_00838]